MILLAAEVVIAGNALIGIAIDATAKTVAIAFFKPFCMNFPPFNLSVILLTIYQFTHFL